MCTTRDVNDAILPPRTAASTTARALRPLWWTVAVAFCAVALFWLSDGPGWVWRFVHSHRGTDFPVTRAQRMVEEDSALLVRILEEARTCEGQRVSPRLQSLGQELGALWVSLERTSWDEDLPEDDSVVLVFEQWGLPETYRHQLQWVPEHLGKEVRDGSNRLGEQETPLGGGWYHVWW